MMEKNNTTNNTAVNSTEQRDVIDLRVVTRKIKENKKLFFKVFAFTFVLSCAWILPVPRQYSTEITLAPEMESATSGGSLSSLASSFGINLGNMTSTDAIYPMLYPDVMESTNFIVSLFDIKVKNVDGSIETDYYSYMSKHQKETFWLIPFNSLKKWIGKMTASDDAMSLKSKGNKKADSFNLSKQQYSIVEKIKDNVTCTIDKKTDVITISVTDQDRLICATLADSVRVRLQNYITEYRTRKSRVDLEYYTKLRNEAKAEYEQIRRKYISFSDANTEISLPSVEAYKEDLENEMQICYNAYTTLLAQWQMAQAKVQERTPAFTIIEGASLPQKPTKPKRMLFVIGMLFLSAIGTTMYIMKNDIIEHINKQQA